MATKEAEPKPRWRRWLLTVPGAIATTVLTALAGAGVTWMLHYLGDRSFQASDAIKLSVERDPVKMTRVDSAGRSAIIPSSVATHGTPGPGCHGFHSWVADNQGVDAGKTVVQIDAQGVTDKSAAINNMRVSIIDTSPSLTGIAVTCPSAGNLRVHAAAINLDATPPTVDYTSDPDASQGYTLAKGETESFIVSATAAKATYRWKIEFDVVVNGVADTLEVGGKDGFTTTAAPVTGSAWEWNYQDGWSRPNPADATNMITLPGSEPLPPTS
jgi:hypothetical protein